MKLGTSFDIDGSVGFQFGISGGAELEGWADGIETLGEWSFADERSPRLRGINWMRRFGRLRQRQWVVHWRLG
ncbi:hypothetical protein [Enhygromyxa salina]|uniref:Uncharacterized protein n=1 Tax=Enhygromyxa salina TaxID=215803 RepID=A0A2S9YMU5_9BACT|nr:hypothetical protein [Enhygromyxa salina]PRQ06391.1 hypothetical protein ENSA7_39370 [Enhygromyxa salina]